MTFVSPMLLGKVDAPFDDPRYIAELKLDGFRLVYSSLGDKPRLYTRHNTDVTSRYPELLTLNLPPGLVLDGELVVCDADGKPDFEACMSRFSSRKVKHAVTYCVFDVLYNEGQSVMHLPLVERKALLDAIIPVNSALLTKVGVIDGLHARQLYDVCCAQSLEGVVLKRKDSAYLTGKRSDRWLKIVNYTFTDVWVAGLTANGDWLLEFDDGSPAGICEFAPPLARKTVYRNFEGHGEPLKVRVKHRSLTKGGYLRTPAFGEFM
ncbi:ATP-dependent DNA ligase [Fictibacillus enclensis]|uniref:ATP-dependent DNA ligase n=1 Tax=Fictibacillus enclensis TaxID=1017270 RepID=UPI0025A13E09|nr:ATP-dependent DNA ligase [Fictibacillus enclensis]MDM5339678.1 ATP-dependent DNA ligase [Fictibacillus enclensis]